MKSLVGHQHLRERERERGGTNRCVVSRSSYYASLRWCCFLRCSSRSQWCCRKMWRCEGRSHPRSDILHETMKLTSRHQDVYHLIWPREAQGLFECPNFSSSEWSFNKLWRCCRPALLLQDKPCNPLASTTAPTDNDVVDVFYWHPDACQLQLSITIILFMLFLAAGCKHIQLVIDE